MEINLHKHRLEDAKEKICYSLDECRDNMDGTLRIVHGHHHGTAIRDYIRSNRFLNDISKIGHSLTSTNFKDEGMSILHLKLPKRKKNYRSQIFDTIKSKDNTCHKCNKSMVPVKGLNWNKCPDCGKLQKR